MANKTNLSSWGGLKSYLSTYIDKEADWDNTDLKDYSALTGAYTSGKITGDQLAEGKILFKNYLADADAENTRVAAEAAANNQARQENAYSNYLNTRLASYLGELQGNAGQKGYVGTTQGQAVAVKNAQENAFQKTEETKRTSLSDALKLYQDSLLKSSETAIGEQTDLQSARDEKYGTDLENYKSEIDAWINGDGLTTGAAVDGSLSAADSKKLSDYLAQVEDDKMRTELQSWLDFTHGSKLQKTQTVTKPDGTVETQTSASDNQVSAAKTKLDTDLASFADKGSYDTIKTFLENNKSVLGGEYDAYMTKLNEKMNTYTHINGKGYSIGGLSKTLAKTDDIDLTINGVKYDLVAGDRQGASSDLNKLATGSDTNPALGTIVEKGGSLYLFKKSRYGDEWYKIASDSSNVSDAVKAWNQYKPAAAPAPPYNAQGSGNSTYGESGWKSYNDAAAAGFGNIAGASASEKARAIKSTNPYTGEKYTNYQEYLDAMYRKYVLKN